MHPSIHPLDALGNPMRREMLAILTRKPLAVGDLASRFPVSRPAISRHLRMLEQAGLVEQHADGTRNVYAVRMEGFASVREYLDGFWESGLERLAALAAELHEDVAGRNEPSTTENRNKRRLS